MTRGEKYTDIVMPCKQHPTAQRYVSSGECVECRKAKNAAVPVEKRHEYFRKYREANKVPTFRAQLNLQRAWHKDRISDLGDNDSIKANKAREQHIEQIANIDNTLGRTK